MNKNYINSEKLNALMAEVVAARDKDALPTSKEEYLGRITIALSKIQTESDFLKDNDEYVKDGAIEHFANAMIIILKMAQDVHGEKMHWFGYDHYGEHFRSKRKFAENLWLFIRNVLNCGMMNITDSVAFIYAWAEHYEIEPEVLDAYIRSKLKNG